MKNSVTARFETNKLVRTILFISLFLFIAGLVCTIIEYYTGSYFDHYYYSYFLEDHIGRVVAYRDDQTCLEFALRCMILNQELDATSGLLLPVCICLAVLGLIHSLIYIWKMNGCTLVVNENCVKGKSKYRKEFELPISKIISVEKAKFGQIIIVTASKKYRFYYVANREEVYMALTELLNSQQNESKNHQSGDALDSDVDKLKRYKKLLDEGVITQEEFDAKKKQILGL